MKGFMIFFDLDTVEVATRLLRRFRDRHQQIWEAENKTMVENCLWDLESTRDSLVDASIFGVGSEKDGCRALGKRMTQMDIERAVMWHERQRHLGYRDLKQLARARILHALPDFLATIDLDDIPVCEKCARVWGMKDR